ncbi:MAG TPA: PKD domain-containing protein [Puia sp.]|nr:PKD domain-containing protein [Puia sp.]
MNVKWVILIFIPLCFSFELYAQNSGSCSALGQTPSTAFPVCGSTDFVQSTVPLCYTNDIYVPGCSGGNTQYVDLNPFWYKFTCYQSGTLGFVITPNDLNDDYDWQLFDVTGQNPTAVFTDSNLFVSGNWSGSSGLTGASSAGTANIECASDPRTYEQTFSRMPTLIQGHNYLLLISHYTNTQSGYTLSFGGGTASIVDPTQPHFSEATAFCDGTKLGIKLNKKISCASLAANGSDFKILSPLATIASATSISCSSGFDMDSVIITLSNPLPPGTYSIEAQIGTDGNTLLDNCANAIPVGEQVSFTLAPVTPTLLDSLVPLNCHPGQLELVFKKPIQCASIASDGSDFKITGPAPITIVSASGQCDSDNNTSIIQLQLSSTIEAGGVYQVSVVNGTDGNSIIDECGQITPVGNALQFAVADTVSAAFTYQLLYGCQFDTLNFSSQGSTGINTWNWTFDGMPNSTVQNPQVIYSDYGLKKVRLIVSNGICSDTASNAINLDNQLNASFGATPILCPEDLAVFVNTSIGKIETWNWNMGDGSQINDSTPPPHQYPPPQSVEKIYTVTLTVTDTFGCIDTAMQDIKVVRSCYITVPNAFTPNGDGINDYLYPLNAFKAINLEFRVYNRFGQLVFETNDWTKKWDGTINGQMQKTDTFVWTLQYTDGDTGKHVSRKGTSTLIR